MKNAAAAVWPRAGARRATRVAMALFLGACVGQPPPEIPWGEDGGVPDVDSGIGQVDSSPPPWVPDAAPPDAELPPETISAARMYGDVVTLASDEFEGREPGTEGNELTMAYVENVFSEIGLEPMGDSGSFRQSFSYYTTTSVAPSMLAIGGQVLQEGSGFEVARGSGSGTVEAELVFVGFGVTIPAFDPAEYPACPVASSGYDDYQGVDVSGKIALVAEPHLEGRAALHRVCPLNRAARGTDGPKGLGYRAANAWLHGAVAVIFVAPTAGRPESLTVGFAGSYCEPDLPVVVVDRSSAARPLPTLERWQRRIQTAMTPGGVETGVIASLSTTTEPTYGQTANIVGAIRGSDPALADEVILIGGHLDHLGAGGGGIYHGADDNASGTAVTMELARMAAGSGLVPKRTLIFAGFNAEEMGLIGSCHMARNFMYPLEDVVVMLSLDMVGAGSESGVDLIGGLESKNSWFGDLMQDSATSDGLDYDVSESWGGGGSDHACFDDRGVSAMLVMSAGSHPYYHTQSDTAEHIQQGNLEVTARLVWAALRPLAMGEESK